jgi:hypothetical protein
MPTTQIRQAAVGMRGVHLANSCAQTAKIARSIWEIRLHNSDHWLGTADSLLRCNLGLESCPQRLFWATPNIARSGQLRPRSCRTRAGLDGPAGIDVLMGAPIRHPRRGSCRRNSCPSVGECT